MRKFVIALALAVFCLSGYNADNYSEVTQNSSDNSLSVTENSTNNSSSIADNSSGNSSSAVENSSDNSASDIVNSSDVGSADSSAAQQNTFSSSQPITETSGASDHADGGSNNENSEPSNAGSSAVGGQSTESQTDISSDTAVEEVSDPVAASQQYTLDTRISDVINDPVFGNFGRLIFPVDSGYYSGETLNDLRLTWYNNIDPEKTVEIANYMRSHAAAGDVIFYDIYSDSEKSADPDKKDTGLFFFKGTPGEKFAVCSAGGGFAYVGAMQDSFPHALELSKRGYNAFAVIYRPGAQTACEDLSRAIAFIFDHADELEVDTDCYSLWGGSAGARMSAWVGSYGAEGFGERALPHAGAVIMQYTGLSDYSENDPPTYVCVGDSDGIASWRTMKTRLDNMSRLGIDTEFHVYEGLRHGFGIGTGTVAEGWLDDVVKFWERQF